MEIGDKVKWMTGIVETTGVFIEEVNEIESMIFLHTIGGQTVHKDLVVKTELLIRN